jgi:hypothetical protein
MRFGVSCWVSLSSSPSSVWFSFFLIPAGSAFISGATHFPFFVSIRVIPGLGSSISGPTGPGGKVLPDPPSHFVYTFLFFFLSDLFSKSGRKD